MGIFTAEESDDFVAFGFDKVQGTDVFVLVFDGIVDSLEYANGEGFSGVAVQSAFLFEFEAGPPFFGERADEGTVDDELSKFFDEIEE